MKKNSNREGGEWGIDKPEAAWKIAFPRPKLLVPMIVCLVGVAICWISDNTRLVNWLFSQVFSGFELYLVGDMFGLMVKMLVPITAVFLLYQLLEVVVIYKRFRLMQGVSVLAIVLSMSIYYLIPELLWISVGFYVLVGVAFWGFLIYQKSSMAVESEKYLRNFVVWLSMVSVVLGVINILTMIGYIFGVFWYVFANFFSVIMILVIPLQMALALLVFTRLQFVWGTEVLTRRDKVVVGVSIALAIIVATVLCVFVESMLMHEYQLFH